VSLEDRIRRTLRVADEVSPPDDFVARTMGAVGPRPRQIGDRIVGGFAALAIVLVISLSGLLLLSSHAPSSPGSSSQNALLPSSASATSRSPQPTATQVVWPSPAISGPNSPSPLGLATSPSGSAAGDALAIGTLSGTIRNGIACLWLRPTATEQVTPAALVWPFGFGVESEPLRIIGPDGQIVAQVGDQVELGGGGPPVGYVPTSVQDPCGLGSVFVVSEVGSVNGTPSGVREGSLRLETRASGVPETCPSAALYPLMLVMSNDHLMLRIVGSGQDVDASWPDGFTARAGSRITILDPKGSVVMTQGDERADVRGLRTLDGAIEVCGIGPDIYQ
jgi:hypothetical protein